MSPDSSFEVYDHALLSSRFKLRKGLSVLNPDQFDVNEAWLVFQLNDALIRTERDGSFNAVCLMDAASCFILATAMVPADHRGPSELETRRLLKTAWDHERQYPSTLFVPTGPFDEAFRAQADRDGISVVTVAESQLWAFTEEARRGFNEHVRRPRAQ